MIIDEIQLFRSSLTRSRSDSYLSTLIERDVLELASIERRGDLLKLIAPARR